MDDRRLDDFLKRFLREQDRVFTFIASLLPDRHDADEVFQEASLAIWRARDSYDVQREFYPWACGVAHNLVLKHLRKQRRDRVRLSNEVVEQLAQAQREAQPVLDARLAALRFCLGKLDGKRRDLLTRCYRRDKPIKEIAQEERTTANALYIQLRRIRQALFDCITQRTAREGIA